MLIAHFLFRINVFFSMIQKNIIKIVDLEKKEKLNSTHLSQQTKTIRFLSFATIYITSTRTFKSVVYKSYLTVNNLASSYVFFGQFTLYITLIFSLSYKTLIILYIWIQLLDDFHFISSKSTTILSQPIPLLHRHPYLILRENKD